MASLAFSEDDEHLMAVDLIWDLSLERLLRLACQTAGRNLTRDEWHEYLPGEDYRKRSHCPDLPAAPE